MNIWADVAIGIGVWLFTTVIYETIKHAWNPIRWRFTSLGESYWDLERVSGPTAFSVTFGHQFTAPPIFADDMSDKEKFEESEAQVKAEFPDLELGENESEFEMVEPDTYVRPRFRDLPRGRKDLLNTRGVQTGFYMFWVECGRRRSVEVRIPAGASVFEIRRRNLMREKLTRTVASYMGLDSTHVPD